MSRRDPTDLDIHDEARRRARAIVDDFAISLVYQSQLIAFEERADEVQTPHVEDALELLNRGRAASIGKNMATLVGGALLGTSADGFVLQLFANNAVLLAAYSVIGFVGLILVLIGLLRSR